MAAYVLQCQESLGKDVTLSDEGTETVYIFWRIKIGCRCVAEQVWKRVKKCGMSRTIDRRCEMGYVFGVGARNEGWRIVEFGGKLDGRGLVF